MGGEHVIFICWKAALGFEETVMLLVSSRVGDISRCLKLYNVSILSAFREILSC